MRIRTLPALLLATFFSLSAQAQSLSFEPAPDTRATLNLQALNLSVQIQQQGTSKTTDMTFQAERPLHLELGDFNFDGLEDFAVWHLDDGMGTYSIHRIFVYNPAKAEFVERFPACGDEFINLRLLARQKSLGSSYYAGNRPRACITRLH